MSEWLEPVRKALAPRYQVDRVLGQGGMGTVFLAQDTRLECPVAVKVLAPQLAGGTATVRFLREARLLATLKHPHIVAIHDVDERDDFAYYVMDHLADETLAHRLRRGPLSRRDALKVGRDLLDALERVHAAGVVHRDIKPANVFLVEGRAVLTDFGIAKVHDPMQESLTAPHHQPHTPGYAAPEQIAGIEIDGRADLYAVGLTLYECYAGLRNPTETGTDPSWRAVPRPVRRVLRRALERDPDRRWPDARSFRRQLWRTRVRTYLMRAAALTAGGIVVGVGVGSIFGNRGPPSSPSWAVTVQGAHGPELDSIAGVLERGLRASVGYVCGPGDCPRFPYDFALREHLIDGLREAELMVRNRGQGDLIFASTARGAPRAWESLADSLLTSALPVLWAERSAVRDWVPWHVLPTSGSGLEALARGEAHLAAGRWSDALRAYQRAVQIDSTCILCSWRITEVERWHVRPPSPQHIGRTMAARDAFPAPFRPLIVSRSLPLQARLDTLVWAAERWRAFHPASFLLGTELFHRGPLLGRPRAEAEPWLLNALALYPDFAPTWELLAWIRIADGRMAAADSALDALRASDHASPPDPLATSMRALLGAAYAYRFDPTRADDLVDSLLSSTSGEMPDLAAGPRLLLAFEAPDGAVALGSRFAFSDSPTLARSGWIARILGFFARGQLDSALAAGREAQERGHDDLEIQSLAPRLLVAWALLDEAGTPALDATMIGSLRSVADTPDRGAPARQSAAWLLRLLDGRSANRLQADPTAIESVGVPALRELIRADSLARLGRLMAALENLDDRIDHQSATAVVMRDGTFSEIDNIPDIFYRTVLNGLTAAWNNRLGRVDITLERLRWHEHFDQHVLPMSRPTVQDVDWAFGTVARWKRAVLLDSLGRRLESCRAYAAVARNWIAGDSVFVRRAQEAIARRRALTCNA